MKKADAKNMVNANNSLLIFNDDFNTKSTYDKDTKELRFYVYYRDSVTGDKGKCRFYLIWYEGSTSIDQITIFNDFKVYTKGNTANLFTKEVIEESSDFYKKYLGKYTSSKLGDYTNSYYYSNKNIEIIELKYKVNTYYFDLTKKASFIKK